ncbi:MAG: hypothetical protein ACRD1K_02760 [Acidimicrobiales bacterium]
MRRIIATLAALLALVGAACSAKGSINTDGDGVQIDGDLDGK